MYTFFCHSNFPYFKRISFVDNECKCQIFFRMKYSLPNQGISTRNNEPKIYIGMSESEFKTRYNIHTLSFKHKKYANKTALSKYIQELKENQSDETIKWSVLKRAKAYSIVELPRLTEISVTRGSELTVWFRFVFSRYRFGSGL